MKIVITIPDEPGEVRHYAAALNAAEIVRRYGASLRIEKDNGELIREHRPRANSTELVQHN